MFFFPADVHAQIDCSYRVTGYVRGHGNPRTFDGTSVWTRESIAAASWNIPIDAIVIVYHPTQGAITVRIADRGGGLEAKHIDVLVDTVSEAYALTRNNVCVERIG